MAQPGLTDRLNQHSQRSGPLVGCGMALAMTVCVVTGIVLYGRIDEFRLDVFGVPTVVQSVPTVPPPGTPRATVAAEKPGEKPSEKPAAEAQTPPTEAPTATPPPPSRYRVAISQGDILNMRASPNTQSQVVARLTPGTTVEDAGEQATGPVGGQTVSWRRVRNAGGQVGWVPEQFLERIGT